jgi:hypothetical protein
VFLPLIFGLLVSVANVAHATDIRSAKATVTCTDYTMSLNACDLRTNAPYTIDYTIDPSCSSSDISGSLSFTAAATTNGTGSCGNDTYSKTITVSPTPPF